MQKISVLLIVCLMSVAAQAGIGLIDDFADTGLSEYTLSVVHDGNVGDEVSFQSPSGALQVTTSLDPHIEQVLFLRNTDINGNTTSIGVGEVLLVDLSERSGLRNDIGIAVCNVVDPNDVVYDPEVGGYQSTREDYLAVYVQADNDNLKGIEVDGTNVGSTIYAGGSHASADVTNLYIRRDSMTQWTLGYVSGVEGWYDFYTGTVSNTNIGNAFGFFGDMRNIDTHGDLDNLRIVPEPATIALLGLGGLALLRRKRA